MATIIIQARMGSSRLPGKMTIPIVEEKGSLEVILYRLHDESIDDIIVATTTEREDDSIEDICRKYSVRCFRGDKEDVLNRYVEAAEYFSVFDAIVRITGDCPILDMGLLRKAIQLFEGHDVDYVSNVVPTSYPDGLDVEVFSLAALKKCWEQARGLDREHVTLFIRRHPSQFKVENIENDSDLSQLGWSLDTPQDLLFIREVFKHIPIEQISLESVLALLSKYPAIEEINKDIPRNIWREQ